MSKKRKFSMTGIVLVICMLICLLLALAVVPGGIGSDKKKNLDDENTPDLKTVMEDGSPLLIFDKRTETKALMEAFDNDQVSAVHVEVNDGETTLDFDSAEAEVITEFYKAVKNVVVGEESDSSAATAESDSDSYGSCRIAFEYESGDGDSCVFEFAGPNAYTLDGTNYAVSGTDGLWDLFEEHIGHNTNE